MTTAAVVICTHLLERSDQMLKAVDSVRAQSRKADEIVVVVDGVDGLGDEIRKLVPDDVKVVCVGANLGVSAARNFGMANTVSDAVAFLDDDAIAAPDWLERILVPLRDETLLGVSGRSLPLFEGERPKWLPDEYLWALGCTYKGVPEVPSRVRNGFGGGSMLRRKAFEAVGGYDPSLGYSPTSTGGGEEADLSLRMVERFPGCEFQFEPDVVIYHRIPKDRATLRYIGQRCRAEGAAKRRVASLAGGSEALGPEQQFAKRIPKAIGAALRTRGNRAQAWGLSAATAAAAWGYAAEGMKQTLLPSRRREMRELRETAS